VVARYRVPGAPIDGEAGRTLRGNSPPSERRLEPSSDTRLVRGL